MIPTYQEQTAIAEVLTASDREIELASNASAVRNEALCNNSSQEKNE